MSKYLSKEANRTIKAVQLIAIVFDLSTCPLS